MGGDENQGAGDTLDAGNLRGLKRAIWASSGQIALLGRFREKPGSIFAVSGPISPGRRVMIVGFRAITAEYYQAAGCPELARGA